MKMGDGHLLCPFYEDPLQKINKISIQYLSSEKFSSYNEVKEVCPLRDSSHGLVSTHES